jgi:hypothetical protein
VAKASKDVIDKKGRKRRNVGNTLPATFCLAPGEKRS